MFKKHLQTLTQATHPCAVAYDYARIRRLVRLGRGFYRLRVADESAIGFSDPIPYTDAKAAIRVMAAVRGRSLEVYPGFLCPGSLTCVQPPPLLV
jgi:hypothetical protein